MVPGSPIMQAVAVAKAWGITLGKTGHERWGEVNTYPLELLDEVWGEKPG